jgi:hypothetical protein
MRITKSTMLAAALILSGAGGALAGEGGTDTPEMWVGQSNAERAGCYAYQLHFLVAPPYLGSERDAGGYVFASSMADDMSLFSGKVTGDGQLHGTLTPLHGKGPAGRLEGHVENGHMTVSMKDSACPMEVPLVNVPLVDSHG